MSTKQKKDLTLMGLLILLELLTITVKTFFWFVDIGRIVDHHF
jgi:hypothetical protein